MTTAGIIHRIERLERLLGTMTQFANENLESFETWIEDNRELDPNVESLATFLDNVYEDRNESNKTLTT